MLRLTARAGWFGQRFSLPACDLPEMSRSLIFDATEFHCGPGRFQFGERGDQVAASPEELIGLLPELGIFATGSLLDANNGRAIRVQPAAKLRLAEPSHFAVGGKTSPQGATHFPQDFWFPAHDLHAFVMPTGQLPG